MDIDEIDEMILFTVGESRYGIDIRGVQEIKRVSELTRVYGSQEVVRGVINLRGDIVSVLDTRILLGQNSQTEKSDNQRIVVVPFRTEQVGLLVDEVDDVISVESSKILPVPPNMDKKLGELLEAIYQNDDEIISIVNREKLLAPQINI